MDNGPPPPQEPDASILEFRHQKLRILRFIGPISCGLSFQLPGLEELVLKQSRGVSISQIELPNLKMLTLSETTHKDRFVSVCGVLRRVIVLRDPKVSTRSKLRRN